MPCHECRVELLHIDGRQRIVRERLRRGGGTGRGAALVLRGIPRAICTPVLQERIGRRLRKRPSLLQKHSSQQQTGPCRFIHPVVTHRTISCCRAVCVGPSRIWVRRRSAVSVSCVWVDVSSGPVRPRSGPVTPGVTPAGGL